MKNLTFILIIPLFLIEVHAQPATDSLQTRLDSIYGKKLRSIESEIKVLKESRNQISEQLEKSKAEADSQRVLHQRLLQQKERLLLEAQSRISDRDKTINTINASLLASKQEMVVYERRLNDTINILIDERISKTKLQEELVKCGIESESTDEQLQETLENLRSQKSRNRKLANEITDKENVLKSNAQQIALLTSGVSSLELEVDALIEKKDSLEIEKVKLKHDISIAQGKLNYYKWTMIGGIVVGMVLVLFSLFVLNKSTKNLDIRKFELKVANLTRVTEESILNYLRYTSISKVLRQVIVIFIFFTLVFILVLVFIQLNTEGIQELYKEDFWKIISAAAFPLVFITTLYNYSESKKLEFAKLLYEMEKNAVAN